MYKRIIYFWNSKISFQKDSLDLEMVYLLKKICHRPGVHIFLKCLGAILKFYTPER